MNADPKSLLAEIFDRHARPYRDEVTSMTKRGLWRGRDLALSWLAVRPGERVLDLGCGAGALTLVLADAVGPSGQVVAVDLAEGMLALVREVAPAHVRTLRMDIERLELAAGQFDAAVASYSLQFCLDLDRALAEARRVLRDGGRLAATFPAQRRGRLQAPIFDEVRELLPPGPPEEAPPLTTRARLSDEHQVREAVLAAGFQTAALRRLEEPLRYDSPRRLLEAMRGWWDWAWRMEQLGPAERRWAGELVLERLSARFGEGPLEIPSPTHVLFARA